MEKQDKETLVQAGRLSREMKSARLAETHHKSDVSLQKVPVNGGWITRDVNHGRVVNVVNGRTVVKASKKTEDTVQEVSIRRSDALKRLQDR